MHTDPDSLIYPPLTAITDPWMTKIFSNRPLLEDLFQEYGSPVNMFYTERFAQVFEKHRLPHTIYFVRKANRCKVYVRESKRLGFGVDTASYLELKQCLDMGCDPQKLVLTTAVKQNICNNNRVAYNTNQLPYQELCYYRIIYNITLNGIPLCHIKNNRKS